MSVIFHPLRVRSIQPDTAESVIVSFDVPSDLREVFGFTQGQYLTLRTDIDGQDLRRSYSICAGVDDDELRVGVRKVSGGVFSNWIHTRLKVGDTLQVMAPQGRFFVPLQPAAHRHYLGIAGGSGITPILSIMKTVLGREPHSRFTLIYGNRTLQSTMFKEEIEDLKNRYLTRLVLHHVFSAEQTDAPLNMGFVNREKLAEFLKALIPAQRIDEAFICGPFQMNDEAEAASRMLAWSLLNANSRRSPSRTMATRACAASPGSASCTTAPTCPPAGSAMPKRSTWMRSAGTPPAISAASASSFIWKGPQMKASSIFCAGISAFRNSASFSRLTKPMFSGASVCSAEKTWCSTRRVR